MKPSFIIILIALLVIAVVLIVLLVLSYRYNKQLKKYYEYELYHDGLTGHTTWNWLWKKIGHQTNETLLNYDFVHFDIKAFRMFNELYNHDVGNEVLKFVSKTLMEQDFILYSARCHNDNFAFVTKPYIELNLMDKLEELFEKMKYVPGYEESPLYFRCGAVLRNQKLRSNDTVADMAKMAQKQGKKLNCTEIIIYDDVMKEKVLRGETLKNNLPEAFLRDEILVYFQPKFDSVSEEIVGAEALVRWMYHGNELMFPDKFIPYLEANNSINLLDEHMIEKVCQYMERWKSEGKKLVPVSINLSQKEIQKESLVADIVKIVDKYDVDRKLLEFEITETANFQDTEYFLSVITQLRNEGFGISIDDFGTGYSSFKMLKDIPVNTLKIDKSFVDAISQDNINEKGMKILEDVVSMTKHLSLNCIAEGVEDEYQKDTLRDWGCDQIQGYYYSKPIPAAEYENKYL